jgi:dUTP pyrophosphatase
VVVVEPLHDDVIVPSRETAESAGFDVRAYLTGRLVQVRRGSGGDVADVPTTDGRLRLQPGDVALVPTGFKARVPTGYEAQIRIRSSMAFRSGFLLPNAPGTIDADYPDEWLIMIKNDSGQEAEIVHGERIAQAIFGRYVAPVWRSGVVTVTTDRTGGLGSTGSA